MQVSVILSTYNSADLLEKVLAGYERQSYRSFELLVADDGSDARTQEAVDRLRRECSYELRHVWHEDRGFRKCEILNRAIREAKGEYLVLSDGDCIPWSSFVAVHAGLARPGSFLSGGYFQLPRTVSETITVSDIHRGRIEELGWLRRNGLHPSWRLRRLQLGRRAGAVFDSLTPTRPSWNGHNASGWKADILRVNGFDERMGWGGEDRELGERLVHLGRQGRQIRHRAICLHLWHARGYVNRDVLALNRKIRDETARHRSKFTPHGITKDA